MEYVEMEEGFSSDGKGEERIIEREGAQQQYTHIFAFLWYICMHSMGMDLLLPSDI